MKTKRQLDAELDRLSRMLPPWLERLRHPAQFWPQFDALAREILDDAGAEDRTHVMQRLDAMLIDNDMPRDERGGRTTSPHSSTGFNPFGAGREQNR
jgi:hypothetical protein